MKVLEFIDWNQVRWGRTDAEIAAELGCSRALVALNRRKLGIKAVMPNQNRWSRDRPEAALSMSLIRQWRVEGLSLESIALRLGVSRQRVQQLLKQHAPDLLGGTGRRRVSYRMLTNVDWSTVGLGEKPDSLIASELGVSPHLVWCRRKELGIRACGNRRAEIDRDLLGKMTAEQAAEHFGVHIQTIWKRRAEFGIRGRRGAKAKNTARSPDAGPYGEAKE